MSFCPMLLSSRGIYRSQHGISLLGAWTFQRTFIISETMQDCVVWNHCFPANIFGGENVDEEQLINNSACLNSFRLIPEVHIELLAAWQHSHLITFSKELKTMPLLQMSHQQLCILPWTGWGRPFGVSFNCIDYSFINFTYIYRDQNRLTIEKVLAMETKFQLTCKW